MLKALIFDLDGTLVDSEPNYQRSDRLFLDTLGVKVAEERWASFVGMGSRSFLEMIKAEFSLGQSLEALTELKDRCYRDCAKDKTSAFPEMFHLNRLARQAGMKTAVASGSTLGVIAESLAWAGYPGEFDLLLSASQVPRGKPFPDVFLEAARQLAVEPAACLVIEDSVYGAQAGLAAGMSVLAVPYEIAHANHQVYGQVQWLWPGNAGTFQADAFVARLREAGQWPG